MTKQFGGRREAPPPSLTDLLVEGGTVHDRAEPNPVRPNHCHPSTADWRAAALARLEAW